MSNCHEPASGTTLRSVEPLLGFRAYEDGIDRLLSLAIGRIRIFDRHLGRAYNTAARCASIRRFLLTDAANRLLIVVHDASGIRRDCPRLVDLQRQFGHGLLIHRTLSPARGVYDPFCVVDGSHFVRRFHFDTARGTLNVNDFASAGDLEQRFQEIWDASRAAVTGTTLGL